MLLVAIIVDPTARVYSFEAPADRKEAVGTPTPATNSMPRQRLRSINRALRPRSLNQCCSRTTRKTFFSKLLGLIPSADGRQQNAVHHRGEHAALNGNVIAIPESGSVAHVKENAVALSLTLTPQELQSLDAAYPLPNR